MDELDDYGVPVRRYEGVGEVLYGDGPPTDVAFDARQLDDGSIVVGCSANGARLSDAATGIRGRTSEGMELSTSGHVRNTYLHLSANSYAHFSATK
jgi:hypothetical protein